MIWEFTSPEGSCHIYIVKAESMELAIEKFIRWQALCYLNSKWPEEIVRDKTNWSKNISVIIIE